MKLGLISISLLLSSTMTAQLYAQVNTAGAAGNAAAPEAPVSMIRQAAPQHVSALSKTDTQIGSGAEATYGSLLEVHYTGWIYNPKAENLHGAQFDSSRDSGKPFSFQLGARQVIKGWEMGVQGMKVGGKRILVIPSYLAYGTSGSGSIAPNSHLVFEIELLGVK